MSLIDSIIKFFSSLFGAKPKPPAPPPAPPPTPRPTVPPDSATEPAQIVTSKVLVIVYDPVVDSATGKRLSEHLRWSRAEDLITKYVDDITDTSRGLHAIRSSSASISTNSCPSQTASATPLISISMFFAARLRLIRQPG